MRAKLLGLLGLLGLLALLGLGATGCAPPPRLCPTLQSGSWEGTWSEDPGGFGTSGTTTAQLTFTGSQVSGTLAIAGGINLNSEPVTGTVNCSVISLSRIDEAVTLTGAISVEGTRIEATFVSGGPAPQTTGKIVLTKSLQEAWMPVGCYEASASAEAGIGFYYHGPVDTRFNATGYLSGGGKCVGDGLRLGNIVRADAEAAAVAKCEGLLPEFTVTGASQVSVDHDGVPSDAWFCSWGP